MVHLQVAPSFSRFENPHLFSRTSLRAPLVFGLATERADRALYDAKRAGRNQVIVYDSS